MGQRRVQTRQLGDGAAEGGIVAEGFIAGQPLCGEQSFGLHGLAVGNVALGQAGPATRLALGIGLDEQWEGELLEAEWRSAEEIAALVDEELTGVPGFDEFRRRALEG